VGAASQAVLFALQGHVAEAQMLVGPRLNQMQHDSGSDESKMIR
jgi:hypothetical protein